MSTLNRFLAKARRAAEIAADKASELAADASHAMKLKSLQIRIDEQYEKLGELVYRDLHVEESLEEEKLAVIAAIDALFDELSILTAEDAPAKEPEDAADDTEGADAE